MRLTNSATVHIYIYVGSTAHFNLHNQCPAYSLHVKCEITHISNVDGVQNSKAEIFHKFSWLVPQNSVVFNHSSLSLIVFL